MPNAPLDTQLFDKAVIFAVKAHAGTERRGKGFPYIIHPLDAVTIVATITSDPELLSAAVLHDVVEDTDCTIEEIRREFGDRIADLVDSESDNTLTSVSRKDPWRVRKQAALDRLAQASYDAKVVAMGDKLSNMRAIAMDYDAIGDKLWERFHAPNGKVDIGWRYRELAKALSDLSSTVAYQEFVRLIDHVFPSDK